MKIINWFKKEGDINTYLYSNHAARDPEYFWNPL